ncbi:uncharacterized protein SAPINGB_P000444 [Magnusiomyces paraingens]|uniref:Aldehyde dehydrogenase n=1 Tax=Magnusiomyces paraingens TaxID=2606893 RepID=A0A5E8B6R6_9ASCO|nr:uncharacterized protein SAPINGB_P000444 [Saprochaete ingens]VVT44521.1 unnamed protein product [Saprochaete ingens]
MTSFKISTYEDIPVETPVEEIPSLVARVKAGYTSYKTLPLSFRREQLRNLYYALYDNQDLLYQTLMQDLHKCPHEINMMETFQTFTEILWLIENLDDLAAPKPIPGSPLALKLASIRLTRQAFGTVLIISPWNYPIVLSVLPIASALAAGNTIVYKPSEMCEHTSRALVKILSEALDPSVFVSITGGVPQSTAVLKLPFDKIMYTGNGVVGRIVARAAAEHLTPTILELGGKSPVVVTATANLKIAARRILWGKRANAGQTCVAPDYLLVDKKVHKDFLAALKVAYHEFNAGLTAESHDDYSDIINGRHFARIKAYLDNTKGSVVLGGNYDEKTLFFPTTIVDGVTASDSLLKEEIFGPLLGIITYTELSEAVNFITSEHDTPLALYIFSTSKREQNFILDRVRCGGVSINETLMHLTAPQAPFGGVGESGHGAYHGINGFRAFSHERTVLSQPAIVESALNVRYPPYSLSKSKQYNLMSGPPANPYPREGPVVVGGVFKQLLSKGLWVVVLLVGLVYSRKFW